MTPINSSSFRLAELIAELWPDPSQRTTSYKYSLERGALSQEVMDLSESLGQLAASSPELCVSGQSSLRQPSVNAGSKRITIS